MNYNNLGHGTFKFKSTSTHNFSTKTLERKLEGGNRFLKPS